METNESIEPWQLLSGKIASEILIAPKTGGDPQGDWRKVHHRLITYLENSVIGKPWDNHLALITAVLTAQLIDVTSVLSVLSRLNCRWKKLFPALGLQTIQEWNGEVHLPAYLKGELLPQDSQNTRIRFWIDYKAATKRVWRWFRSLETRDQGRYQPFILPVIDPKFVEGLVQRKEVENQQKLIRKQETDAIVSRYVELRAEAHFRYNKTIRLRHAWLSTLERLKREHYSLPFSFSYQEGAEELFFRVWDKRSFVLSHQAQYSKSPVLKAQKGLETFSDERNTKFLELVSVERLVDDAPAEGFWFEGLLKQGVLGQAPRYMTDKAAFDRQQAWLQSWGYEAVGASQRVAPFWAQVTGLLTWPQVKGESAFMAKAQLKAEGLLIPVEPFYAAATFGLLGINLFTTTGMRINEAMQVRLDEDCFVRLQMPVLTESKIKRPSYRYLFRLIPKGERTNTPHDYFIGEETKRLLVKVAQMLEEHYEINVDEGETLPNVEFSPGNGRAHRFSPAPYLFQYNHKHLSDTAITACMRFLLHGIVFKTREGKNVTIKAHLLRHAFATYAVQVEKIPVDIVGAWLKQKDLDVTDYYSQPTESMIAQGADSLLARLATHIDVGESVRRSPEELQQQYEEAFKLVGTLTEVSGGHCACHSFCPAQFACVGCAAKVPDPSKRHQVEHKKHWAQSRMEFTIQENLLPETEKMKQLIRDCETELQEMNSIEQYREDENNGVEIRFGQL